QFWVHRVVVPFATRQRPGPNGVPPTAGAGVGAETSGPTGGGAQGSSWSTVGGYIFPHSEGIQLGRSNYVVCGPRKPTRRTGRVHAGSPAPRGGRPRAGCGSAARAAGTPSGR